MTKISLEKIILLIFFVVILYLGPGVLFDHKIKHDFPFAYGASDAFQHQIRAEAIKDMGKFEFEAPYIMKGLENVVGIYPPIIYHLSVMLSYASGIEVFDSIYFIVVFFPIIASLIMYIIIRNFNKTVALLSLPLSFLIYSMPPSLGFLWGHWPSVLSQLFLMLFFWSIMRIDLEKSYWVIAISMIAMTLTHTSEASFALIFLALFFGLKLITKTIKKEEIKKMFLSFGIFFIISFYYLIIFYNTWYKAQPYEFMIQPIWEGNPGFYLIGFGLLLIPIIFGMIYSLTKLKGLHVSLILGFAMLISGFSNYFGFYFRAFQIRFFWPIYLSVFIGLGIYILFKPIVRKWNALYTIITLSIITIFILGIIPQSIKLQNSFETSLQNEPLSSDIFKSVLKTFPQNNARTSPGLMNPFHWEALSWLSENTAKDSKIYFFYGDIYNQDALLRNSKRFHYQIEPSEIIKAIQDQNIKRNFTSELPGDSGGSIVVRTGIFSFENAQNLKPKEYFNIIQDICTFDYIIFDKVSRQQAFAQYNLLIASELIKKDYINGVFENDIVVILKNDDIGADCIEKKSF